MEIIHAIHLAHKTCAACGRQLVVRWQQTKRAHYSSYGVCGCVPFFHFNSTNNILFIVQYTHMEIHFNRAFNQICIDELLICK